ncbi:MULTISPECIES: metal-dependent hydrolase [Metabacillus]|uniref:Metal-dependent hydrolase n=1 Tax=Metabacillus rhizolycopersici TaxID=2875709 RepID=A0ABS7USE7_9BACI|nr:MULTISPECIES: metal-dependent hydrolase [Metabacillus]MBZ5751213.1 metal-dependent hydrolase [Metabacillus rhizolycopersici]MCM3654721.1 metal-dependent hydrolase [Metabacillus litoralis]
MDTGTHVVMGIALGGIATLDPVVGVDHSTAYAVMLGTIIGSQAPDLDTILKLRNNAKYIRNHRGITHSIPAVFIWSFLITGLIMLFVPESNLLHLWLWTFFAIALHVFVDIFNAYGTQALRPFTKKWIALGIINTFDPFIFIAHLIGIAIWVLGAHPGYTFLTVYIILMAYYIIRFSMQRRIIHRLHKLLPDIEQVIISPTMRFRHWHIAIMTNTRFHVARSINGEIILQDEFERIPVPQTNVIRAAEEDDNISAFLSFSPVYRWEVDEFTDHYEVRFIDLRYRSKGYYPFVAIVQLDYDLNIVSSYTGWIFSEEKLRKKLELIPD